MTGFYPLGGDALGGDGAEAAASATGQLTATLGAITTESAGQVTIRGALAQTLGDITGGGQVTIRGALAQTLGAIEITADGDVTPLHHGDLGATLGDLSVVASGRTVAHRTGAAALFIGA